MRVTPVVITLGRSPRLERCLTSISRLGLDDLTVCVVNEVRTPRGPEERGGIVWLYPGMNLGWAGASHLARQQAPDAEVIWFIQDDMEVARDAFDRLSERLREDGRLAAVRPCVVNDMGVVETGACGAVLGEHAKPVRLIPEAPSRPTEFPVPANLDYLPSSGLMVRTAAWDATGGFNPWFYPVGCIDQDFGLTLTRKHHNIALVTDAVVLHAGKGSTPSPLGHFCEQRHRSLLAQVWFGDAESEETGALISPAIVEKARSYRDSPEAFTLPRLREIAGAAAADSYILFARWQARGFDKVLADYAAVTEARDWWRNHHDRAVSQLKEMEERLEAPPGARRLRRWPRFR